MTLAPGTALGPYAIAAQIGTGGMGEVYRARDTRLNRLVAIKFLSSQIADESSRRRFQQEAKMASALNHPNIVTVYEIGELDGQQYLVTEFVDGGTLGEWAETGPRSWQQILDLLVGVGDGLAAAHSAGILHRDIKPGNILVSKSGYAKLADFGLAKLDDLANPQTGTHTITAHTRPGAIIGTIPYMSPEQASGKALDARSDIFSFGVVLYELLAQRRPFRGATDLEVLQTIIHGTPEPLAAGVPYELRLLVEKALEKAPGERYQTMRDVVVDLKRIQRHSAAGTKRDLEPDERPTRWHQTRWVVAGGIATTALIALAVLWRPWQQDDTWHNPLTDARSERLTDFEGTETDAVMSPDGKVMVCLADRGGRFDVWLSQIGTSDFVNVTQGKFPTLLPGVIRRVGFVGDDGSRIWISEGQGSGPYTLWTASVLGGEPRRFLADVMEPAWSPDGKQIAYHTAEDGDPIFVADSSGRGPKRIFAPEPGSHRHHLAWSPDARFVYFVMGRPTTDEMDIWRIPVSSTPPVTPERITTHNARVAYLGWLDDRTLIYSGTANDGSGQWLYALDVEQRVPHKVSAGIAEQYLSVTVSNAKPRRLIASVATPSANLWTVPISDRVQTEANVSRLSLPNTRAVSPSVASDYVLFLSSKGGGDGLWKLEDGDVTELWKGSDGGVVAAPAISRDGTQICFTFREQGRSHLYLMSSDGTNVRRLTDAFDVRSAASWSPDGKWVAVAAVDGKGTHVYKVPVSGGSPVRLTESSSYNPMWSPDGRLIVYSEPLQGSTFVTKAITPDKVAVPIPDIRVSYLTSTPYRFAPDGNGLIFLKEGAAVGGAVNFYMVDFKTGHERQLTNLDSGFLTRSFDLMPGRIIFDRLRENSDLAVIDLVR